MNLVKIENYQDLVRDEETNAVLNNNKTARDKYLDNYHRLKKQQKDLEKLKDQVSTLSSDMGEIKSLLKLLVQEKNNVN